MPNLVQLAKRYQTQPIGAVHDAGALGEYLCVGLSDERGEPLQKYDLDSGQATRSDAWWRIAEEGFLVQARVVSTAGGRSPGVYGRTGPSTPYVFTTWMGVFDQPTISREAFEGLLSLLASRMAGFGNPPRLTPEFTYLVPIEPAAQS